MTKTITNITLSNITKHHSRKFDRTEFTGEGRCEIDGKAHEFYIASNMVHNVRMVTKNGVVRKIAKEKMEAYRIELNMVVPVMLAEMWDTIPEPGDTIIAIDNGDTHSPEFAAQLANIKSMVEEFVAETAPKKKGFFARLFG